jgi:hypothetical protein
VGHSVAFLADKPQGFVVPLSTFVIGNEFSGSFGMRHF